MRAGSTVIPDAVNRIRDAVGPNHLWQKYLDRCNAPPPQQVGLHLGVFIEPFLRHILDGKKTIEARFSCRKVAPFACVEQGDVLLLKRTGGPIIALCEVLNVWSYQIHSESLSEIRRLFADAMCASDNDFWSARESTCYATLLRLGTVQPISPVSWEKRDRRGWVVLRRRTSQLTLW